MPGPCAKAYRSARLYPSAEGEACPALIVGTLPMANLATPLRVFYCNVLSPFVPSVPSGLASSMQLGAFDMDLLANESANQSAHENVSASIADFPGASKVEIVTEVLVLLLIFALTLVGNVALWIVVLRNRDLRKVSNYFILCLSGADILVIALNLPFTVTAVLQAGWLLGDTFCQVLGFVNMVTFVTSTTSLAAISVNR
ncbi:NPFFR2 [Branchiostoma lanceolatum]|uniref:NPFFR2 protein n=1 Tax=Branchiostoma lanceolatum TaxID=7740 RepID=A0A8J9VYM9_BRALA|nr:NPFFR2 [Branchiostoma lanceolatum]